MMQKTLFSMVIFIKSIVFNLTWLIDLNTEMVLILNMKFLKIVVIIAMYQLKVISLSNVSIS